MQTDNNKPYSIIGTSPAGGHDYWVPYCPTFSTIQRAKDHACAVWGQDWQGGRYSLRVGIITPDGAVQDLAPYALPSTGSATLVTVEDYVLAIGGEHA